MKKKQNKYIGIVSLGLAIAVVCTLSAVGISNAFGLGGPVEFSGAIAEVNIDLADGEVDGPLGGSTSDNWNVGGNLAVTGTSALTGAVTMTGALGVAGITSTGEAQMDKVFQGGTVFASSSLQATTTLTAAQICDNAIISVTLPDSSQAINLPATSTLAVDCLATNGDSVKVLFMNESAAATTTTITSVTDMQLISDDADGDVIAGQNSAWLTIIRRGADAYIAIVDPFTDAD